MQDLDRRAKNFLIIYGIARSAMHSAAKVYNGAIWCTLKCILIKFQGKNNLKISLFPATTTKKAASLLGEGVLVRGNAHPENCEKIVRFGAF